MPLQRYPDSFGGSFAGITLLQFLAAFAILVVPATFYGISFPWIYALYAPGAQV